MDQPLKFPRRILFHTVDLVGNHLIMYTYTLSDVIFMSPHVSKIGALHPLEEIEIKRPPK